MRGQLYVISGPSGVGKGTVVSEFLKNNKEVFLSVSATTRAKREGEQEGINYYYKTHEEFVEMIENNEFMEWAQFCDNYYGTPKATVENILKSGKDVILEIEVQGAMQIKKNFPESIFVFVLPPSIDELEKRLINRGTESEDVVRLRIETAKKEIVYAKEYDYLLVNDIVEKTVCKLSGIIISERCKTERIINELEVLKWFLKNFRNLLKKPVRDTDL